MNGVKPIFVSHLAMEVFLIIHINLMHGISLTLNIIV